jgi:hypothetical protein
MPLQTIGSQMSGESRGAGSAARRARAMLLMAACSALGMSCASDAGMEHEGNGVPATATAPGVAAAPPSSAAAPQAGGPVVPPSMMNQVAPPPTATDPMTPAAVPDAAVTYHKSIRPIIQQRCVGCHFDGGAGGFALTDWTAVQGRATSVVAAVMSRKMPPWLADASPEDCVKLADDQRLTDEQLAMFSEWESLGFPEGLSTDYVEPQPRAAVKLGEPTMLIQSAQPQRLSQNWEQYIDTPMQVSFPEDTYVVGIDVKPETESVVHHAIVSIGGCTALGSGNIYSYRPGSSTVVFGEGSAMLIRAGSTLCTQFHYNTLYMGSEIPATEHSTLRLWTMPAGERPKYLVTRHPNHIMAINIAPGAMNQEVRSMIGAGSALNPPAGVNRATAQIVGLSPHMHALGVKFSETMYRADGSKICLMNVPKWDWEWQIDYMFAEPLVPEQSDRIEQICTYSNTPEQQLLDENGQPLAPRFTTFGEGTRDEMCLGYIWMRYEMM